MLIPLWRSRDAAGGDGGGGEREIVIQLINRVEWTRQACARIAFSSWTAMSAKWRARMIDEMNDNHHNKLFHHKLLTRRALQFCPVHHFLMQSVPPCHHSPDAS
nr:hypothetical protein CFP56_70763 [Quercus suber]